MIAYYIETLEDAENLVKACDKFSFDIDVMYGTQTLNAKSFLGVTSLLGNFVSVIPITDDDNEAYELEQAIKPFRKC